MPSKADFGTLLKQAQGRWQKYDEQERKKREREQKQLQRVDAGLTQGRSWEDISKNTGLSLDKVREYSQQTRPDYGITKQPSGIEKLGSNLKNLGYGVGRTLAKGTAQTVNLAGEGARATAELGGIVKESLLGTDESYKQRVRDAYERIYGKEARERAEKGGLFNAGTGISPQELTNLKPDEVAREIAGRGLETAAEVVPLARGYQLATRGARAGTAAQRVIRGGAEGAAVGAIAGTGSELTQDEFSARDVGLSTLAGGVLGGAIPGAGALINRGKGRGVPGTQKAITDESRLLPERGSQGADVITDESRLLPIGAVDHNLAVVSKGADINDVKKLQAVEKRITEAQQKGNITVSEARGLMQQRRDLTVRIQNPTTPIGTEMAKIDNEIVRAQQSGNKAQARVLEGDRTFLEQEATRVAKSAESAELLNGVGTGAERTTRLSQRAETKAIENNLAKGFENKTTYQGIDLGQQADQVVNFMDVDYDAATRVAMGQDAAPAGINAESVYIGVMNRAAKEGDADLVRRLAEESTITRQASIKGQQIASLRNLDEESPVVALQSILKARKDSPMSVPRTITKDEAEKVTALAQDVAKAKEAIANGGDRLAYGRARIIYDDYVGDLIAAANKRDLKEALKHPVETTVNLAGLTKSLVASLDNSALLRQGWKTLFTHPGTWAKNSAKTFSDFVKAVGGKNAINEVRADIMSRPNSINGMYKKMGVDVFGIREEAFPTSLPGKIPVAGRLFKGSEAAYTGFQQRTRADLADKYLEIAQASGVDLTSKKELKAIGKLVNSLTSRGDLGRVGERASSVLNNVFFSPRLLKSNIDVLTGHQFQSGVTPFVRKRAARNLLQIALGSAAALKLASEVTNGKVEWDPRSSNFGKVRIGDTRFDLSGGIASIATLGARVATASSKSSTTGEVKRLNTGEFGSQTSLDTIYNFFENKTSPALSVVGDYLKGETFQGEKPTLATTVKSLTLPLIIANYNEIKDDPRAADVLPSMIAESLGVSANTYSLESKWNASNSKRVVAFKEKVGKEKFEAANKTFNERFNSWYDRVSASQDFWRLPQDGREKLVLSKKDVLTEEVMEQQGFKYRAARRSSDRSTERLIEELRKY